MTLRAIVALATSLAATPVAGDILLGWPIDCRPGATCTITGHVDRDPGPGFADYTCGLLSRDGQTGTVFVPNPHTASLTVRAAAPGKVRAIRDGRPEGHGIAPPEECGNGIVLDHGGGWQTQYCHLARGSIAVAPGQRVAKGTPLGRAGQSGGSPHPQLMFRLVRKGRIVDPFAPDDPVTCGTPVRSLWQDLRAGSPRAVR